MVDVRLTPATRLHQGRRARVCATLCCHGQVVVLPDCTNPLLRECPPPARILVLATDVLFLAVLSLSPSLSPFSIVSVRSLQTVVCLSLVDLILGGFFLFVGLWILLDWRITSLWAWLPFVIIGGLLMFTTFLRCRATRQRFLSLRAAAQSLTTRGWRAASAELAPTGAAAAASRCPARW